MSKKSGKRSKTAQTILAERRNILSGGSSFYTREAYKTLRTNVNFSLADSDGCRVLLLTSALQSEGKSITALNLAISLAEDGNRVLLIDADLRRPKLGRLTEVSSNNGLSDILIHPELLDGAIYPYRMNLDVMLAGRIPPNPSELLGSARMGKSHWHCCLQYLPRRVCALREPVGRAGGTQAYRLCEIPKAGEETLWRCIAYTGRLSAPYTHGRTRGKGSF